jgi:hypothetical protein
VEGLKTRDVSALQMTSALRLVLIGCRMAESYTIPKPYWSRKWRGGSNIRGIEMHADFDDRSCGTGWSSPTTRTYCTKAPPVMPIPNFVIKSHAVHPVDTIMLLEYQAEAL